jgi:hypothetical protein
MAQISCAVGSPLSKRCQGRPRDILGHCESRRECHRSEDGTRHAGISKDCGVTESEQWGSQTNSESEASSLDASNPQGEVTVELCDDPLIFVSFSTTKQKIHR